MRVLIADDEKMIRKGIVTILSKWQRYSLEIEEARNGEEALQMHNESPYDLIISDIRMPKMTGLEFLKAIYATKKKTGIIFISGYDDFNYAKEAIRYGASAYLLKPINKEELLEMVSNLLQNKFVTDLKNLHRYQLQLLFLSDPEVSITTFPDGINQDQNFFVGLITLSTLYIPNIEFLVQELREYVVMNQLTTNVFVGFDKKVGLITSKKDELFLLFYQSRTLFCGADIKLTLSNIAVSLTNLKDRYLGVCELSEYHKLLSEDVISELALHGRMNEKISADDHVNRLASYLHSEKKEQALKQVESLFSEHAITSYTMTYFTKLTDTLAERVIRPILMALPENNKDLKHQFEKLYTIKNFDKIEIYRSMLIEFVELVTVQLVMIKSHKMKHEKVQRAMEYVMDQYHNKELNMTIVSNHVSLNYSYFSQLFKEVTGENFIDYLAHYRIKRGKEMLMNTSLKIYEIADKVGYKDPRHFLKVFKVSEGLSPVEFRNKINFESGNK